MLRSRFAANPAPRRSPGHMSRCGWIAPALACSPVLGGGDTDPLPERLRQTGLDPAAGRQRHRRTTPGCFRPAPAEPGDATRTTAAAGPVAGALFGDQYRMGRGREILPPMPIAMYQHMNDADLGAIFAYLQSIPAIVNHVPDPLPPGAPVAAGKS